MAATLGGKISGALERLSPSGVMPWKRLAERARQVLYDGRDSAAVADVAKRITEFRASDATGARRPELAALQSLADWRQTGEVSIHCRNVTEARLQLWEIELRCPVLAFQKLQVAHLAEQFPSAKGFLYAQRILDTLETAPFPGFIDPESDIQICRRPGAELTVLGFSGLANRIAGCGWTLFDRAVTQQLGANLIALRDFNSRFFLSGIKSLGDREQTMAWLRERLEEFRDTRVVAIGGSAGVFSALHVGAELGLQQVVAVSGGPTSLEIGFEQGDRPVYLEIEEEIASGKLPRPDLPALVAASPIRRVDFFVAGLHDYDMRQMRHLKDRTDVVAAHVFEDVSEHNVLPEALEDGSLLSALRNAP